MRLIFLDSNLQGPVKVTLALMLLYQPSIVKPQNTGKIKILKILVSDQGQTLLKIQHYIF